MSDSRREDLELIEQDGAFVLIPRKRQADDQGWFWTEERQARMGAAKGTLPPEEGCSFQKSVSPAGTQRPLGGSLPAYQHRPFSPAGTQRPLGGSPPAFGPRDGPAGGASAECPRRPARGAAG